MVGGPMGQKLGGPDPPAPTPGPAPGGPHHPPLGARRVGYRITGEKSAPIFAYCWRARS